LPFAMEIVTLPIKTPLSMVFYTVFCFVTFDKSNAILVMTLRIITYYALRGQCKR